MEAHKRVSYQRIRFALENHHKSTYMPFAIGHRMCINKDFTLMEGQAALARIASRDTLIITSETPAEPQFSLLF